MDDEVRLTAVVARPTAVVAAATTWDEFPALWPQLLGGVWDCLHAGGVYTGCRNVMLYLDEAPNVEVGVLLDQPCPLTGRVRASTLPPGTVASTVHRGPFQDVGRAHDAVVRWCTEHGRRLDGTRWEVYGRTTTIRPDSGPRSPGCCLDLPARPVGVACCAPAPRRAWPQL